MPRLVIKVKKKRPPTVELSRLKEQLRRLDEHLTSRDRELAEAAATGTNSVMDAIAKNVADCAIQSPPWCGGSTARQARHCTLGIDRMQVQEEDDVIDRAFIVAAPMIGREEEVAPKKSPPGRSMWRPT